MKFSTRSAILFPGITVLSILLLCGGLAAFSMFFSFDSHDAEEYWQLMDNADSSRSDTSTNPYVATQQHRKVNKDIIFCDNGQRLHMSLQSNDSELVLNHRGDATEIIENMYDLKCYMQEELYYVLPDGREVLKEPDGQVRLRHEKTPVIIAMDAELKPKQLIRYLQAATAAYSYKDDHFIAENVHVSHFSAPGHTLVKSIAGLKPLMSGIAQSVEFSVMDNDLNFKAHQMKATLHAIGR
jgi:hypothetical protein